MFTFFIWCYNSKLIITYIKGKLITADFCLNLTHKQRGRRFPLPQCIEVTQCIRWHKTSSPNVDIANSLPHRRPSQYPLVESSYITELIPNTKNPGDEFLNIDKRPPLWKRERERKRKSICFQACVCIHICVCVCGQNVCIHVWINKQKSRCPPPPFPLLWQKERGNKEAHNTKDPR